MRYRVQSVAVVARLRIVVSIAGLMFAVIFVAAPFAYALDTTINVTIMSNGSTVPTLTLDGDGTSVTVSSMPFTLSGGALDVDLIDVYVDDILSVTIPLGSGATSFSYGLIVPSGSHVVKLIGTSSVSSITPSAAIAVTYTPQTTPPDSGGGTETGGTPATPSQTPSSNWRGSTVTPANNTTSSSTTYVAPINTTSLPDWVYNGLVALDIAKPGDVGNGELVKMAQRATLTTSGLFLLVFARPALLLYRTVRYSWLGLRGAKMPKFLSKRPLLSIRIAGLAILGCVLAFF